MVHTPEALFTEQKWYLVAPVAGGSWSDVVSGWVSAGATAAGDAVFYHLVYKLHEPVAQGTTLSEQSWEAMDITATSPAPTFEANVGYFVYVSTPGTEAEPEPESEPEPEPEAEPEAEPEPEPEPEPVVAPALLSIVVSEETGEATGGLLNTAPFYAAIAAPAKTYGISLVTADDPYFDNLRLKSVQFDVDGAHYTSYDWNATEMNVGGAFDPKDSWELARTGTLNQNQGSPAVTTFVNTCDSGEIVPCRNRDMEICRITPNHKLDVELGYETTAPQILENVGCQVVMTDMNNLTVPIVFRGADLAAGEQKLDVVVL